MKIKLKVVLIGVVIATVGLLASFKITSKYVVRGYINGLSSGKIYLNYEYNNATVTDSTDIKNGSFTFEGTVPEPLYAYLKLPGENSRQIYFFIENSPIYIQADINQPGQIKIKGSATQDVMQAFNKVTDDIKQQNENYGKEVDSIYKSNGSKPGKRVDSLVSLARHKLMTYDFEARKAFVSQHAESVFCAYMINTWYVKRDYALDKASELFTLLTESIKTSYYGKQAQKVLKIQDNSTIGSMPDFTLKNVKSVPVKLSSFRGKYVLVDFWASWCAPCRKQNPNLVANYTKYHTKGFEIVGVSLDTDKQAWLKAIKNDKLSWPQLSDLKGFKSKPAIAYGIKVIPSNFLLNKEGKVIGKNLQDEELTNKLMSIFKN